MDIFNNSYIKSYGSGMMKNYNADEAYGANMVPGSQNINPNPMRDSINANVLQNNTAWDKILSPTPAMYHQAGGAAYDLFKTLLGGGAMPKAASALSSSGSPLTIPAGTKFSDVAPTLHDIQVSDLGDPTKAIGTNLGLSMGPAMLERLFGRTTGAVSGAAAGAAKTGLDVAGAASGNPMSMVSLPFDLLNNIKTIGRLFR